jgi:hypothetical protein
MQTRNYDRISNGCVIAAVLSALGFSELGRFHLFFGALAMAAGAGAAVVYFWNQRPSNRCESITPDANPRHDLAAVAEQTDNDDAMRVYTGPQEAAVNQVLLYFREMAFAPSAVLHGHLHRTRVDEIVEIVERLSCSREEVGSYEFVFTTSGDFLIRPASRGRHGIGYGFVEEMEEVGELPLSAPLQKPS